MVQDKTLLISFVFFLFVVFLINNFNISGRVYDVSDRYCVDSDKGISAFTPGYVESDIGTFYDRCQDNLNQIREYSCKEGRFGGRYQVASKVVNCGSGYRCFRNVVGAADSCLSS